MHVQIDSYRDQVRDGNIIPFPKLTQDRTFQIHTQVQKIAADHFIRMGKGQYLPIGSPGTLFRVSGYAVREYQDTVRYLETDQQIRSK